MRLPRLCVAYPSAHFCNVGNPYKSSEYRQLCTGISIIRTKFEENKNIIYKTLITGNDIFENLVIKKNLFSTTE